MSLTKFLETQDVSRITLGADIEYFVYSGDLECFIPASYITDGTKDLQEDIGDGISVHADNIALEHTVPVSDLYTFEANMIKAFNKVKQFVKSSDYARLSLSNVSEIDTSDEVSLQMAPEYTEFGCTPFKTPDGKLHDLSNLAGTETRYAGLHIHIGYEGCSSERNAEVIKLLDAACIAFDLIDTDSKRSNTYGIAGAYRDTPYGVEYRRLTPNVLPEAALLGELASLSVLLVLSGNTISSVDLKRIDDVEYLTRLVNNVESTKAERVFKHV